MNKDRFFLEMHLQGMKWQYQNASLEKHDAYSGQVLKS